MKNEQKRDTDNNNFAFMPVRLKQAFIGALVCLLLANLIVPFPMLRTKAASLEEPDTVNEVETESSEDDIDYILGRPMTEEELAEAEAQLANVSVMPVREISYSEPGAERYANGKVRTGVIPSSYDLRTQDRLTSVKNQNPYGTCWTFATVNSAESNLITTNKADKDEIDLSERHLAYFTYHNKTDRFGNIAGDSWLLKNVSSTYNYLQSGGNGDLSANTLTCQIGLVDESLVPYPGGSNTAYKEEFPADYAYDYNSYIIDNVKAVSLGNPDYVKEQIIKNGAAYISMYWKDVYYNANTAAFNNTDYAATNHAVSLVGWDDNYSRSNFKSGYQPSGNGAWLIKNSWGPNWGKSGYFWISYEDKAFSPKTNSSGETVYPNVFFYLATNASDYSNIYQYDGVTGLYSDGRVFSRTVSSANGKFAAAYTARATEQISAVMVGSNLINKTVQIDIYKNLTDPADPESGTNVSSQLAKITDAGYTTLTLTTPVTVVNGNTFSVVISNTSGYSDEPAALSVYSDISYSFDDETITSSSNENECFTGYGSSWSSLNTSISIKALTSGAPYTPATGISLTGPDTVNCDKGAQFTATLVPDNATDEIVWSATKANGEDASDLVIISAGGLVTILMPGDYIITATANGHSASWPVTALRPATTISFSESTVNLAAAQTYTAVPEILPADHTDDVVLSWSSSATNIASVDAVTGKVTALAKGKSTITATYEKSDGSKISGSYIVSVTSSIVHVKTVAVTPKTVELVVGVKNYISADDSVQLKATVSPANATFNTVTWESLNPDIATVDDTGFVTAIAPGTATITATADGVTGSCTVNVYTEGRYLEKYAAEIVPGRNYAVNNADYENPKWFKYTPDKDCCFNFFSRSMAGKDGYPTLDVLVLDDEDISNGGYWGRGGNGYNDNTGADPNKYVTGRFDAGDSCLFVAYGGSFYVQLDTVKDINNITVVSSVSPEVAYSKTIDSWPDLPGSVLDGMRVKFSYADDSEEEFTVVNGKAGKLPLELTLNTGNYGSYEEFEAAANSHYDLDRTVVVHYVSVHDEGSYENEYIYETGFLKAGSHIFQAQAFDGWSLGNVTVNVVPDSLDDCEVALDQGIYIEDGSSYEPAVTVKRVCGENEYTGTDYDENGKPHSYTQYCTAYLQYDEDSEYTVSYANNSAAGTATATVTGDNSVLSGSKELSFRILPPYDAANDRTDTWEDENGDIHTETVHVIDTEVDDMLRLKSYTASFVKLEWDEIEGTDSYYVQRAILDTEIDPYDDPYDDIAIIEHGTTEYTDDTLTYGTPYAYRVVARTWQSISDTESIEINVTSDAVDVITDLVKPVLTASSASFNSIKLAWNKIEAATGYYVYRSEDGGEFAMIKKITKAATVTCTDSKRETGKEYTYYVRPYKVINKVEYPAADSVNADAFNSNTAAASAIPAVPAGLTVTPDLKTGNIKVAWKAVAGATIYKLERSEDPNFVEYQTIGTDKIVSGKTTSYIDEQPAPGKYYYRVKALTNDVEGNYSLVEIGNIQLQTPVLSLVSLNNNSIKIKWDKIPYAKGYEIWRSFAGEEFVKIATITKNSTVTYNNTKLITGTKYSYKVVAYDAAGNRSESNIISETPTLAAPTVKVARSGFNLKVTWSAVAGASKYEVYRSVDGSSYKLVMTTKNAKTKAFADNYVSRGVNYTYKVRAVSTVKGKYSSPVTATPNLAAPSGFAAKASGYDKIILSWKKSAGADYYIVYRSNTKNGVYHRVYYTDNASEVKYTDYDIMTGQTYYYVVKAARYTYDIYNGTSNIGYSNCTPIKSATAKLPAPQKVKVTKVALKFDNDNPNEYGYKPKLTWNRVAGAYGYAIYRNSNEDGGWTLDGYYYPNPDEENNLTFSTVSLGLDLLTNNGVGYRKGQTYQFKICAFMYDEESQTEGNFSSVVKIKM